MANLNFGVRFRAYTQQFVQKVKGTRDSVRDAYQDMREQARIAREQMGEDFENTSSAGDGLANAIKSIRNELVGMAAAAVGIYSVQRNLTDIVSTGAQFETLRTQLNSVMGSIEAGEQATAWVKDFTKTTPFDLAQVTDGFIKLKAFGLDPMDGTYQAIVDQASKLGGSQETLTGITMALGQAWAKQKLQGEEILQLVERGVPVWELLEKATGKNTQQLQALSEAGKLGRKEIKALIEEIGKSADGAAADQMKTWNGMMSNLKDQWADFLNTIAEAGVLDYLKEQITALNAAVADLGEEGLREYAKNIADAIIGTAEALKTGAQAIWDYRYALGALVGAIAAVKLARLVKEIKDYSTVVIDAAKETRAWAAAQALLNGSTGAALVNLKNMVGILATRFNIAVAVAALGTKQLADAWRESEMAAARETIALSEKAGQYAKIAAGQAKYAGTYIKTAEELERADQAGLDAYEARLSGAQKYYQALLDEAKAAAEYGQDSDEQLRYATENLAAIEAAMVSLKAAQDAVTNNAPALTEAAQEIINQFDLMRSKGDSVKEALDKAFAGVNFETVADVQAVGDAIQSLQQYAKATGDQIDTSLSARLQKLSMTELEQFRMSAQLAFTATGEQGALLGRMMDATAGAAIAKLGLDITQLKTGMTSVGQEAVQAFTIAAQSGTLSATQIETAFAAALGKIQTQTGIEALTTSITNLGEQGQLSAEQIEYYLELAGDAATRLGDDFSVTEQRLADGLGRLGVSMDYLRTGMTEAGNDAVLAFSTVVGELDRAGESGKYAADTIMRSFESAFDRIETTTALEKLEGEIKKAYSNGQISAEQFNKAQKQIEKAYEIAAVRAKASAKDQVASIKEVEAALMDQAAAQSEASGEDADSDEVKDKRKAADKARKEAEEEKKEADKAKKEAEKKEKEREEAEKKREEERAKQEKEREKADRERERERAAREAEMQKQQEERERELKRQQAEALERQLRDTVAGLETELARMNGNTEKVLELRYQQEIARLQDSLDKAGEYGSQEARQAAQQALQLQNQIYQGELAQLRVAQGTATTSTARTSTADTVKTESTKVVRLQLDLGTGEPVEGQYSEADADRLLRQLEQKGAVTR
jgi:tape measure domain-containing protein